MSTALSQTDSAPSPDHLSASQGVNLSSLAHRAISDMIRDRRLKGGESIIEARLADTLGISRTPLREALQRLEARASSARWRTAPTSCATSISASICTA